MKKAVFYFFSGVDVCAPFPSSGKSADASARMLQRDDEAAARKGVVTVCASCVIFARFLGARGVTRNLFGLCGVLIGETVLVSVKNPVGAPSS